MYCYDTNIMNDDDFLVRAKYNQSIIKVYCNVNALDYYYKQLQHHDIYYSNFLVVKSIGEW